jgi:hypothetical protein
MNTGKTHKLAAKQVQSDKRDVNVIPLIDHLSDMWTGEIGIGTPPKKFKGRSLFCVAHPPKLTT